MSQPPTPELVTQPNSAVTTNRGGLGQGPKQALKLPMQGQSSVAAEAGPSISLTFKS